MDKKNIGSLFDSIAGTYDRFNHLLSLNMDKRWRRRSVAMLDRCDRLLDVAAGTADLSMEVVRQDKAAHVTGADISRGMLDVGAAKVAEAGMADRISLVEGSALDLQYGDDSFDAVCCAYGVRNFSDLDKGLSEMRRVLRDGGQLMVLEFSYPSNRIVRALYDFFFSNVMPLVGKVVSRNGGAYKYFRDSVKGFIWGQEMADRLSAAGFSDVKYKTMTSGITTVYLATVKKGSRPVRNILFDFDGTLADTAPGILATQEATFKRMGVPVPSEEAMRSGIGLPLGASLQVAAGLPDSRVDEAVAIYRELFYSFEVGRTKVFPEVIETLQELKDRGIRMAIATSRGARSLGTIMERFGMDRYFETVVTASDNLPAKPDPAMVLTLMERMGIGPEDTMVVGDTVFDIGMGRNAGCLTCAVTYGNHSRERILGSEPTWVIDSFGELKGLLP